MEEKKKWRQKEQREEGATSEKIGGTDGLGEKIREEGKNGGKHEWRKGRVEDRGGGGKQEEDLKRGKMKWRTEGMEKRRTGGKKE